MYPLRVKPTFESEDGGGVEPSDITIHIEESDLPPLITPAPVKKSKGVVGGGSKDAQTSSIQFQALESGYKRKSGFWVSFAMRKGASI